MKEISVRPIVFVFLSSPPSFPPFILGEITVRPIYRIFLLPRDEVGETLSDPPNAFL